MYVQYMGNEIPEPVKDKIKKLLYSWKVGLPNEAKIADAFEMLKKQGLIFDESEGPDHTLQALSSDAKVKVTLKEDPRQSEVSGHTHPHDKELS
jgi:ADP-ribosylation factor-binding protein GGA